MTASEAPHPSKYLTTILIGLLAVCIVRIWIMPSFPSLWVDEIVTTFVLRFPNHPSFSVAPQVPDSLYYWLPKLSWDLFGASEKTLRLPGMLAMGAALVLIARIAIRIIHPRAGWLAAFFCMALTGINYFAVDARPYGLGVAVASAGVLFLIRWFDNGRWADLTVFVVCASLLWRIHLLYWPFYLLFIIYGLFRIAAADRKASLFQIIVAVVTITAALMPEVFKSASRLHGAEARVFNPPPTPLAFVNIVHLYLVAICGVLAGIIYAYTRRQNTARITVPSWVLVFGWWLITPACIFAYSTLSGNGLLIPRYVSLMYPGVALTSTALLAKLLPESWLKPVALSVGIVGLALMGQWIELWPRHQESDWRAAAAFERAAATDSTPVLCPSPFIEAQEPAWTPDYQLPGFLYANLTYYPVRGKLKLFPFTRSYQANMYADKLLAKELIASGHFLIYGSPMGTNYLLDFFANRPELSGWKMSWTGFGGVIVTEFKK